MNLNILGSEWTVERRKKEDDENLKDIGGYADISTRKIIIAEVEKEVGTVEDIETYLKSVTRHEIVHAFLMESGLHANSLHYEEGWANNEEMVDWFALQGQKIYKAWMEACAV